MVTVKGRATWDVIDIILDVNKYQDKVQYDTKFLATKPSVHYTNPGLPKPRLELIDGDRKLLPKEMVDANLDLDLESTDFHKYNRT